MRRCRYPWTVVRGVSGRHMHSLPLRTTHRSKATLSELSSEAKSASFSFSIILSMSPKSSESKVSESRGPVMSKNVRAKFLSEIYLAEGIGPFLPRGLAFHKEPDGVVHRDFLLVCVLPLALALLGFVQRP